MTTETPAPPPIARPVRRVVRALLLLATLGVAACVAPTALASVSYLRDPETLVVPVSGVRRTDLRSTFGAPRPGGRSHRGADIFARRGTPILAATNGVIWRVGNDRLGGRVVWMLGEGPALYYYAHLDDWAPGMVAGRRIRAGQPLGFVGNTGNARTTPPHLHFGIYPLRGLGFRAVDPVPPLQRPTQPFDAL